MFERLTCPRKRGHGTGHSFGWALARAVQWGVILQRDICVRIKKARFQYKTESGFGGGWWKAKIKFTYNLVVIVISLRVISSKLNTYFKKNWKIWEFFRSEGAISPGSGASRWFWPNIIGRLRRFLCLLKGVILLIFGRGGQVYGSVYGR